jgi:Tol biopolymer transport system component
MPLKMPAILRGDRRRKTPSAARFEPLEGRRLLAVNVVSVVDGTTTPGNAASTEPSVSANGRYVVFSTTASNLVGGGVDTNSVSDIYLLDRGTDLVSTADDRTILVSFNSGNAAAGNGASVEPSISADGRYVSFTSSATDMVTGDNNDARDIFRRDLQTNTTVRVSNNRDGNFPNDFSAEPHTSADGNFVAFTSRATNITPVGVDRTDLSVRDVFLRDMSATVPVLVSVTPGGVTGNGGSFDPSVSGNGRYVAFRSEATDLVAAGVDTNAFRDIYVRDMTTNATTLVSKGFGGAAANGESDSPSISSDGNYIVFSSTASNLVAPGLDANGAVRDVFVFNRTTNEVALVSNNQSRTGTGNGASSEPSISQDGRFAGFTSEASDLVTGDGNGASDVFLYDLNTGAMNLVSANPAGVAANGASHDAFVAPEGRYIVFSSVAGDLVTGDANGVSDVFVATTPSRQAGDTAAPTASISQADQPSNVTGATTLQFTVSYADDTDLATTSFGDNDVTVTLKDGSVVNATKVSSVGSGRSAKVTYSVPAPGGTVDEADNGLYTVTVRANGVSDANNNFVAAGALPQVQVTAVPADGPDLTATIPDALPAAVSGSKGRARVVVANAGNQPVPRRSRMTVSLWLSQDGLFDSSDTLLVRQTKAFKANPGQGKRFTMKFVYPSVSASQQYQVLAVADETGTIVESREQNNVGSQPVIVAPPFVDIAATVGAVPAAAAAGQRMRVPVSLINNGNVTAKGPITFRILASADNVLDAGDTELISLPKVVSLKPGKARVVPLSFRMPAVAAGTYYFIVQANWGGAIGDINTGNNTEASDNQVVVS